MKSDFFKRTLRAFKLASPFALAARTDDLKRCVEASLVGAQVLRDRTIDAKAVPCCIVGANRVVEAPVQLALGLNRRDIYARLKWGDERPLAFEEWVKTFGAGVDTSGGDISIHMAIDARAKGERVILDPTIGQLRTLHPIDIPMVEFFECYPNEPWPAFATRDGWDLQYEDSPHAAAIREHAADWTIPQGWIDDLDDLMQLAIDCNLNDDRFFGALRSQQPKLYALAEVRLLKLARG